MGKHLVIVNPAACGGACGRRAPAAVERLRQAGLAVEVVETRAAGDAIGLAKEAVAAGHRSLIAAGGDGTLYEVVNGVLAAGDPAPRPCVGALPLGSGNSFLRDFGDGSLDMAVSALVAGRRRACDVVRVSHDGGSLHFVNIFGLGFVAAVGALRLRRFARLGALGYVLGVLVEVARLRSWTLPMTLDGGPLDSSPATFVAVCNSRFTGGTMMMAPAADTGDGVLDVVHVGALSRRSLLATFPKIFKGAHVSHPAVRTLQGRTLAFELDAELDVLVDGEILRMRPRRLEVLPGAVDIWA